MTHTVIPYCLQTLFRTAYSTFIPRIISCYSMHVEKAAIEMPKCRPQIQINVIFLGHASSGKSTIVSCLTDKINRSADNDRRKLKHDEKNSTNNDLCKFASPVGGLKRDRELDVELNDDHYRFETGRYTISVVDMPGHRNFMKNMITGTSQADFAVVVISACAGELATSFSADGQTESQIRLAMRLGIKNVILAVNKMDTTVPPYSESRYNQVVEQALAVITGPGYDKDAVPVVPVSGTECDNIMDYSHQMPWFRGWTIMKDSNVQGKGKTLLEAFDQIQMTLRPEDRPLRIPVQDVWKIGGIGIVPKGRVESGVLRPGMPVIFGPTNLINAVKSIEEGHDNFIERCPGESAAFSLVKKVVLHEIKRGHVVGSPQTDPPRATVSFDALVVVLRRPGELQNGYVGTVDCHTVSFPCTFTEILQKCDRRSGKLLDYNPKCLKSGDVAVVHLVPSMSVCLEAFSDYPALGRFIVKEDRRIVAVGLILTVNKKAD